MRNDAIAALNGVHKYFDKIHALRGVDLEVRAGELLAILGPNGAGKSTAISLLLGLQQPTRGSVTLFGKSPHSVTARRKIGVMMQEVTLAPDLNVGELVSVTSSYYPEPLLTRDVLDLTQTIGLEKRPYGKLSGGQKRLAQFAMAICGRPQLLFLDEPTAGLDVQARERMGLTIRQLLKNGTSIVLTTHYLEEAEALADRVVVLAKGSVVAEGSVSAIRSVVARKKISCVTAVTLEQVRKWDGVQDVQRDRQRLRITAIEAESIVQRLLSEDAALSELEVTRAGLAEAFVELTQENAP